jgi:hypothetical protein
LKLINQVVVNTVDLDFAKAINIVVTVVKKEENE